MEVWKSLIMKKKENYSFLLTGREIDQKQNGFVMEALEYLVRIFPGPYQGRSIKLNCLCQGIIF